MRTTGRHGHLRSRRARSAAVWLLAVGCLAALLPAGQGSAAAPVNPSAESPRGTTNGYGPGLGLQTPGHHWGGAYTLANVAGYAYCIEPGNADPVELPTDQWTPVAYPGSAVYSNGEMAALAYFAERYQGTGYPGWDSDQTAAAIEQVAYASAGGTTPAADLGPATLVALIEQYIVTYAGPWTIQLSMTPAPSSTFYIGTNYTGTITVTSATGNGVGGLQLTAPPTGGPGANQVSNFVWLANTTNAAGQLSFEWNISGVPTAFAGIFSAQGIDVIGDAVGSAPPTYAAPGGSGGQMMMVSGPSEVLGTSFGGVAATPPAQTGTLSIEKHVPDAAYYGPGGAVFEIENLSGQVMETLTTDASGDAGPSVPLPVTGSGTEYRVHETKAPPGYALAPDQLVTVHASPTPPAVAAFTGDHEEPALAAQLGVAKVDATTGDPLAGATFDFKFDVQNDGRYSQDLGSCTTGPSGSCQPPDENTDGGWLAGWYEITETQAPPGYWLDLATATKTVYVGPGATDVTTVTFGDNLLGSLELTKTGNDTAYLSVAGAQFSVSGPAPSTAAVGTLTVQPTGTTTTLSGLVPGTYTVTETEAPAGYMPAAPFDVAVTAGQTTTTAAVADQVQAGGITIAKVDATTGDPLAGATFDVRYDSADNDTFDQDLGSCTTTSSGSCSPPPNDGTGYLPGDYEITETQAPPGYWLDLATATKTVYVGPGATDVTTVTFGDNLLGSLELTKTGNDTAYLSVAGAQFSVSGPAPSTAAVGTLTVQPTGTTTTLSGLVPGTYTVTETEAPAGYMPAAPFDVAVTAGQTTTTAAVADQVQAGGITIAKVDATTGDPLAGATFDVRYDSADNDTFDQDLGSCTTTSSGSCSPPPNDGTGYLPGDYEITETQAPPGYWLDPATATKTVYVGPGATDVTTVTFGDNLLGSLELTKTGNDTAYLSVAGAQFSVSGPAPSTAAVGTLTVQPTGTTTTLSGLVPGTYTVTETEAPAGYMPAAPFDVAVTAGQTTTTAAVADQVQAGGITIAKVDATTGDPLAGATFDVRYDSADNDTFDQDLGSCTTTSSGSCSPPPNDGTGYLPGDYEITETQAPPGYWLDPATATREVTLAAGQTLTVTVADALLVPAAFAKVATGSYNPTTLVLAGAVIDVTAGPVPGGATVATCTTGTTGTCTTAASLVSGQPYCWQEVSAPPGLASGATGCFVATNAQGAEPITVTDRGLFVAVTARKVDAADPTALLPGAVFDLYRVDGGHGPPAPVPPAGAATEPGQTWVARATTGSGGTATFPLQFPGYAYCVLEAEPPANYVLDSTEQCTGVLSGTPTGPAPVTTVTVPDREATVAVSAYKFDSATPDTGIPGAVYDLYVEGSGPPSGPPSPAPPGAADEQGDTWWERGTTDATGVLSFTVPAGYAWCFHEVTAPANYLLDPALHCTAVLSADPPVGATRVAIPESRATVELGAYKYNSEQPGTVIPGATYELLLEGPVPPGYDPPSSPSGAVVPAGDSYWGEGTTDAEGRLSFTVPSGFRWCLRALTAPPGYQPDLSLHCTAVLTTSTATDPTTIALPEQPVPSTVFMLAFTGGPSLAPAGAGAVMVVVGTALMVFERRRRRRTGTTA